MDALTVSELQGCHALSCTSRTTLLVGAADIKAALEILPGYSGAVHVNLDALRAPTSKNGRARLYLATTSLVPLVLFG